MDFGSELSGHFHGRNPLGQGFGANPNLSSVWDVWLALLVCERPVSVGPLAGVCTTAVALPCRMLGAMSNRGKLFDPL